MTGGGGGVSAEMIRRIEMLEQKAAMAPTMGTGGGNQSFPDDVQPRIIKDKMTDQIRIEETLVDYMEIINGLNAKLNNHIHSTKVSLRDVEVKANQSQAGSYINNQPNISNKSALDDGLNNMKISQQLIDYGTEIEKLRLDILS